ncbi:unnamed protein product [Effrenium voratum]|nr:unnamed protein product [Effrenium voratum]
MSKALKGSCARSILVGAMGNGHGLCAEPAEPCTQMVHQCLFPMYVVKISDFLEMAGTPEPYQVLQERGLLHKWSPGMFVIFVSHQWLGVSHPDPEGQQLSVLRKALRSLLDNTLTVEADISAVDLGKKLPRNASERMANGYLFLDWFAIPQVTARIAGVNDADAKSDAALAVQSIPAYVEASDLFIALVPPLTHVDTGVRCSYVTWLSRGWCRAELWCRLLSIRKDPSVIVLFSAREAEFMFPIAWQERRIVDGLFTVESDRAIVTELGRVALSSKLQHLRSAGPLSHFRLHQAIKPKLLGQVRKNWGMVEFLQEFNFADSEDAIKDQGGMTGLLCAVLGGEPEMIRTLVELKADVHSRAWGLSEFGYYDSQTLLMVACKSSQETLVLTTLIDMRADASAAARSGITADRRRALLQANVSQMSVLFSADGRSSPAGFRAYPAESSTCPISIYLARHPGQIQALLAAKADPHDTNAITGVAGRSGAEAVQALLDARCDPDESKTGFGPLHALPMYGRSNSQLLEVAQVLIDARADVNMRAYPSSTVFMLYSAYAKLHARIVGLEGLSGFQLKLAVLPGCTPLAVAAIMGEEPLIKLLLDVQADPNIPNDQGDAPKDLALALGRTNLLPILDTFHV